MPFRFRRLQAIHKNPITLFALKSMASPQEPVWIEGRRW